MGGGGPSPPFYRAAYGRKERERDSQLVSLLSSSSVGGLALPCDSRSGGCGAILVVQQRILLCSYLAVLVVQQRTLLCSYLAVGRDEGALHCLLR